MKKIKRYLVQLLAGLLAACFLSCSIMGSYLAPKEMQKVEAAEVVIGGSLLLEFLVSLLASVGIIVSADWLVENDILEKMMTGYDIHEHFTPEGIVQTELKAQKVAFANTGKNIKLERVRKEEIIKTKEGIEVIVGTGGGGSPDPNKNPLDKIKEFFAPSAKSMRTSLILLAMGVMVSSGFESQMTATYNNTPYQNEVLQNFANLKYYGGGGVSSGTLNVSTGMYPGGDGWMAYEAGTQHLIDYSCNSTQKIAYMLSDIGGTNAKSLIGATKGFVSNTYGTIKEYRPSSNKWITIHNQYSSLPTINAMFPDGYWYSDFPVFATRVEAGQYLAGEIDGTTALNYKKAFYNGTYEDILEAMEKMYADFLKQTEEYQNLIQQLLESNTFNEDQLKKLAEMISENAEKYKDNLPEAVEEIEKGLEDIVPDNPVPDNPVPDNPVPDNPVPDNPIIPENQVFLVEGLEKIFPFCIPFDLMRAFEVLSAEPKAPRWELPLKSDKYNIDYIFVIDLADFEPVAKIFRIMQTLLFIVGLILATRSLIRG